MKLVNQSFNHKDIDCDEILGHVYKNEREYQGSRCHMRLRYNRGRAPMMEWWDERPGGSGHNTWATIDNRIEGHIEKYVGYKFDDCFSDFIRKCKYNKDYQIRACGFGSLHSADVTINAWRRRFIEYFKYTIWGSSYIVEDGIIRHNPEHRSYRSAKHTRNVTLYDGDIYYTIKPTIYRVLPFIRACNNNLSAHEWATGKVSEDTVRRIRTEFTILAHAIQDNNPWVAKKYGDILPDFVISHCKNNRWNTADTLITKFFERVDERERTVLKYHSKEWYQYMGVRQKRKKIDRGAFYDRSLWADNYIKTHPNSGLSWHDIMGAGVKDAMIQNFELKHKPLLRGRWTATWDSTTQAMLVDRLESIKNDKTIPNY